MRFYGADPTMDTSSPDARVWGGVQPPRVEYQESDGRWVEVRTCGLGCWNVGVWALAFESGVWALALKEMHIRDRCSGVGGRWSPQHTHKNVYSIKWQVPQCTHEQRDVPARVRLS